MIVARTGSPIDNGTGPVRWAVIYRGQSAFIFAGASRSALDGVPEVDGLIKSTAQTLRGLKPSEFPLAEPYRIKVVKATAGTKLSDYAADMRRKIQERNTRAHQRDVSEQAAASRPAFQDRRVTILDECAYAPSLP